jgi:hypothetical protein
LIQARSSEVLVMAPAVLLDEARTLLRTLSAPHGIRASSSSSANYGAVFARDAVMAGIAGLLTQDSTVSAALARTLWHLRDLQGDEGQIASSYEVQGSRSFRVSFGSVVPRLDAPLWYLIGIGVAARADTIDPAPFERSVRAIVRLLEALEYNGRHLLYVPAGGDWADEYVYEGYILHDQVLRAWALRLASDTFDEPAWGAKAARVEQAIEREFWPADASARGYPLAAFTPTRTFDMFDLATCSLMALAGIAPAIGAAALHWIAERFLSRGELPPAFQPVIDEGHPDWPALQRYQPHGFRNRPHEYQNGGIWPLWLGWLGIALARHGRMADLERLRAMLGDRLSNTALAYEFEAFLHGVSGAPGGMPGMACSATGLLLLDVAAAPRQLSLLLP